MATIDLKGKVALVTGSARRVGKAIALGLAAEGMHLVVHHHSSSDQEAAETADAIRAYGVETIIVRADQSRPDEVGRLFERVRESYGRLDVLVNSASNFRATPILDVSYQEWRDVIDTNLTGPFLCSQQAAGLMREKGGGAIVNIIDLSAFTPWKTFPHHSVSKAGLKMLTEVLALSLGPDIRVNAVAPGPVLRDEGRTPEEWQRVGQRLPLQRTGQADDVAQAVIFLAKQPYITGTTLRVDGGELLV